MVLVALVALGWSQEANAVLVYDHFDDGHLDPSWNVVTGWFASGWSYFEDGTSLTVTDISSNVVNTGSGDQWAAVSLSRDISPMHDFDAQFAFSWDSAGSVHAMQIVYLQMLNASGDLVCQAGYDDSWLSSSGSKYAEIAGAGYTYTLGTLPLAGSGTLEMSRSGNEISILWGGSPLLSGTNSDLVATVSILFEYYDINQNGTLSSFGTESVDLVSVTPEPATLSLLALGGLAVMRRRRR
jgi:hypothetical protein